MVGPFLQVGARLEAGISFLGGIGHLLGDALAAIPRGLIARRGRRMGWRNLWEQTDRVGNRSIPIVSLVLFCIGAILAFQLAPIMTQYGMLTRVADIISLTIFRELGPLMAAIVLTGFAGASIAAEMGTFVVSEEIEALEASAIEPVRFLVTPRILATTIMLICVAMVADLMGVLGGLFVAHNFLGVSVVQYTLHTFSALKLRDFITGLAKAGVFGVIISSLACYLGLGVTGGAQGVGNATTRTVVLTIVMLIFVDLIFNSVFYFLGL